MGYCRSLCEINVGTGGPGLHVNACFAKSISISLTCYSDVTLTPRCFVVCECISSFTMTSKRKRVVLSVANKLKIKEQLGKQRFQALKGLHLHL